MSYRKGDWCDNDVLWEDYPKMKETLNPVSFSLPLPLPLPLSPFSSPFPSPLCVLSVAQT